MPDTVQLPVDIDEGKIKVDDQWLTVEDIKAAIKEKIDSGDYDVASHATALKQLEDVVANIREITFKITANLAEAAENLANERSVTVGAIIREALGNYTGTGASQPTMEFEEATPAPPAPEEGEGEAVPEPEPEPEAEAEPAKPTVKPTRVQCHRCKSQITITTPERPITITCPQCGERGRLT